MNVKDLKNALLNCDDNDEVILSTDEEGNGFSPLTTIEPSVYDPDNQEIHIRKLTKLLRNAGFTDEDLYYGKNGINAIVLWP